MSTFTKEQKDILVKTAKHMIEREKTSDYSENLRKVAEIALAALESRADANSRKLFTCSACGAEGLDEPLETQCHCLGDGAHWVESTLYTRPQPAPVVVDFKKLARELVENLVDCNGADDSAVKQYQKWAEKTCRAAMLQGKAEPVSQPYTLRGWIPCSERMPAKGQEVLCTDQFENYETALYDTGYIPGPPFFATTAGEFHPTHWMPLPAPPL